MNNANQVPGNDQHVTGLSPNPRKAAVAWYVLLPISVVISVALGREWGVPWSALVLSTVAAVLTTAFAATPYIRFFDHGWWTRYDEFRNELWGDALSEYLWHFWHRRADEAGALHHFETSLSSWTERLPPLSPS